MTRKPDDDELDRSSLLLIAVLVDRLGGSVTIPRIELVENDTRTITVEPTIDGGMRLRCQK